MYDMDDYNGPDDYDGYLHDNEKEVIVDEEEMDILLFFEDMAWVADQIQR